MWKEDVVYYVERLDSSLNKIDTLAGPFLTKYAASIVRDKIGEGEVVCHRGQACTLDFSFDDFPL